MKLLYYYVMGFYCVMGLMSCTLRTVSAEGEDLSGSDWPMKMMMHGLEYSFTSYYEDYDSAFYDIEGGSYGRLASNHYMDIGGNRYNLI